MDSHKRLEGHKKAAAGEDKPRCDICLRNNFAESILSCHRCITVQHTFCLPNPLIRIPDRRWLCQACKESSTRHYTTRLRRHSNGRPAGSSGGVETRGSGHRASPALCSDPPQANGVANGVDGANGSTRARRGVSMTTSTSSLTSAVVGAAAATNALGDERAASGHGASSIPRNSRVRRSARKGALAVATSDNEAAATAVDGGQCTAVLAVPGGERSELPPGKPCDPGSTVTLFCRRDFRRYLRWKRRELANQDNERIKDRQIRARKTFSSIIASNGRR